MSTTTTYLDWATTLAPGAQIVPVILVAGVPVVLTPAGVRPTMVAMTIGVPDSLWWPGGGTLTETLPDASTFDPVADLLDPRETFEVYESVSVLKGDVRVEALTFSMVDTDGLATALLSAREGRLSQLLASEVNATDTSIPLVSSSGFPASGIACLGRETFLYSSVSGNNLVTSLVTRGKYGSPVRLHGAPASHLPLVTAGGPRHWQSRLATLWLCALSADGTTLTDPTLFYAGTIGAGVQLKGNLSRWSVPIDHVTESLSRKINTAPIDLYGFAHYSTSPEYHPLCVAYATTPHPVRDALALQWSTTNANDNGGWHPSLHSFVEAANRTYSSGTTGSGSIEVDSAGKLVVRQQGSNASPRWFGATACWDLNVLSDYRVDDDTTPAAWVSRAAAPEACFLLKGWVKIPMQADFARIPTTLAWTATTTDGSAGYAALSLVADTRGGAGMVATILERRADADSGSVLVLPSTAWDPLCVKRTPAKLGIIARGASVVATLRAAALGIDALTGQDLADSAVDWDHLERAFADAGSPGLPQAREYRFVSGSDSLISVLIGEMRLRGMCLAMRFGKITGVRLASVSDAEAVAATITESDLLAEDGKEIPVEVVDNTEPLATSVAFSVLNGTDTPTVVTIADTTFTDEFGSGEKVECSALLAVPESIAPGVVAALAPLYAAAQQILGPLAEPSRAIRLALTPLLMGLQTGQLVALTHSRIPAWTGGRGVAAVCQVAEVRRVLFGGRLRATAVLRLQSSVSGSYCPEAIIAAGGLTGGSPVVTLDLTTGWGPQCHAQDHTAAGAAATSPTQGFAVGDVVVLSALSDRTPIADEQRTIVAVGQGTITLDSAPSAGMVSQAASAYGATLRWAAWGSATARQHKGFAWVADATTGLVGGAEGKRWAS